MFNKAVNTRIICSLSNDPWYNLALEEYLLKEVNKKEIILYLWQNNNTIVIGRNQNPWKECKCKEFDSAGGKIARRLSGGGAVFHDLGNLNFTFIMDKNLFNLSKQLKVILDGVNELGITANFSGRNDIVVGDKKFSGNAFYNTNTSSYHHGTILVNSNMDTLSTYLKVSKEKIASKGIDSVSSRVVNLKSIKEDISVESVKKSIMTNFIKNYGGNPVIEYIDHNIYPLESFYNKYSSWEWIYGETPKFHISFTNRFKWGEIDLNIKLRDGLIDSAIIYSDAMNANLIKDIEESLNHIPFQIDSIVNKLHALDIHNEDRDTFNDIEAWLKTKI